MNSALASPHRLFKQSKSSVLLLEYICILTSPDDLTPSKSSSEFPLQGTCSSALELRNATTPNEILDPHMYSHFPFKSDFFWTPACAKSRSYILLLRFPTPFYAVCSLSHIMNQNSGLQDLLPGSTCKSSPVRSQNVKCTQSWSATATARLHRISDHKHIMAVAIVMVEVEVTVEKPRARQVLLKSKRKFCLQL
jgi:hypothetical protein